MTADANSNFEVRRRSRRRTSLWLVVPSVTAAALTLLPLVYLFVRSFSRGAGDYVRIVATADSLRLLLRTVMLAGGVVIVSVVLALPIAWIVTRTDVPGRRLLAVLASLPLVFPSYLGAYVYIATLGPRGLLQQSLSGWNVSQLPELVYGFDGALLVLSIFSYPYVLLPLITALRRLDPTLEEASRVLGRGRGGTFFHVVLPQLRTPLLKGSLLVAMYTISDFGAVSLTRFDTFTVAIYTTFRSTLDRTASAALATLLIFLTVLLLIGESGARQRAPLTTRATRPAGVTPLGRWRLVAFVFVLAVIGAGVLLPIGTIVSWSFQGGAGELMSRTVAAAASSLSVSMAAAVACLALAIPLASWMVRRESRTVRTVEKIVMAGYALPGLVTALALVFFATRVAFPLYQTLTLLVLAYIIRFLPEAVAAGAAALAPISRQFEEAARVLGRSEVGALLAVVWPLSRNGFLAGAGLVFLTAAKELPATLILRPTGFETLATRIWSLTAEAAYGEAALPAVILLAVSAIPVYFLVIRPTLADDSRT